jgi:hypothetical protein
VSARRPDRPAFDDGGDLGLGEADDLAAARAGAPAEGHDIADRGGVRQPRMRTSPLCHVGEPPDAADRRPRLELGNQVIEVSIAALPGGEPFLNESALIHGADGSREKPRCSKAFSRCGWRPTRPCTRPDGRRSSANVANADTPGYRAGDLRPFAETYRAMPSLALRTTRPGHMAPPPQTPSHAVVKTVGRAFAERQHRLA